MARVAIQDLSVVFGTFTAVDHVDLDIADGELVVFLGPSGCGKTTTLRCVAGLERVTDGAIRFDGHVVNELRASERNIAMVFQFVSLYPHLSVRDNIAFPLRARGVESAQIRQKLDWAVRVLKLGDVIDRYPRALPPGSKQKVALARAVVRDPNVLLLDEPLSAIDEQYREEMRWELGHLQRELGFTTVYVTHDQREAMSLADRIVLMRDGRIVQVGAPPDLLARPVDEFVGHFIGSPSMNFIDAVLADGGLLLGEERLALPLAQPVADRLRAVAGEAVRIGVRPQHVTLGADGLNARIVDVYAVGRDRFFDFVIGDQLFVGANPSGRGGDGAAVHFDHTHLHFFDPDSGRRLEVDMPGQGK